VWKRPGWPKCPVLEVSLQIRESQIQKIMEKEKPKSVAFQAPDGLLTDVVRLAGEVERKYGVETVILLDPTWGTCDLANFDAKRLGVDLIFNIGHSVNTEKLGRYTYMIDAEYEVNFRPSLDKAISLIKERGFRRVGVVTISNHKSQLNWVVEYLRKKEIDAIKGVAEGALFDGQVFGCNYHSARNIAEEVDCFLFLGQSRFHAIGVYLSTRRPTFMVDPFFNEVVDMMKEAQTFEKKAVLSILRAKEAKSIGIISSLKEGQYFRKQAVELKKELEKLGKVVFMFSLREITAERLRAVRGVEAFIETACPRVSLDHDGFDRPVLSYQQALGLIRVLKGKDVGDIFDYSFWV
jgi:2-(3-amino-3-carboxypropyl)histidine synthase